MNILVTGASGFMGERLVKCLLQKGYKIRVLVRDKEKGRKFEGECEIHIGDITKKNSLSGCCEKIDVVYNLAALMGHDSPSPEAFSKFRKTNVEGLKNLVDEAKKSHVKRFIHISSTAAMGLLKEKIVDENTACKPYTPYQVTKREGELLLLKEYRDNGFPVIILRPSMIYGPGFKGDFLTLAKVCKTGFFPKIGTGKNLSPALYISDLIDLFPNCVERGKEGEIYIVSSERSYGLRETALIISKALKKRVRFIFVPRFLAIWGAGALEMLCHVLKKHPPVTKRNIQSTVTDRVFNVEKAKKELGFKQKVSLEKGLTETVKYFLEQKYI